MPRRVLGVLATAGVVLVSWVAVSQPGFLSAPAPAVLGPAQLLRKVLRPGFLPMPEGSPGPYLLQHGRASALFRETGVELRLPSQTRPVRELGWSVVGGRAVRPQAEKPREVAFLQQGSRVEPSFGGLRYPGVRPGVDLWFEERPEGVEYGFRAGRGADLTRVELEYTGAHEVRVVDEGRALEVDLEEGVLREEGLWCAQELVGGASREVGCRFTDVRRVGRDRWAYAIEVDVEDPQRPVVVDPVIRWSTYLGGGNADEFGGMAVTDAGEIFVVGTFELDSSLRLTLPLQGLPVDGLGVVIARFQEDGGSGRWMGLKGNGADFGRAVTVGKDGMLYVAGETTSGSFGTGFAYCLNHGAGGLGKKDAFIAQFDPVAFQFRGIYLVGTPDGDELVHGIASGADGGLFLVGQTTALDFPGAPVVSTDGGQDAFVSRLRPSFPPSGSAPVCPGDPFAATLEWSTLGHGVNDDVIYGVTVDEAGRVYVVGKTAHPGLLPASAGTHSGPAGTDDVFVARLNPADGGLEKGIYLGGQGNDEGRALALKGTGDTNLFVAGTTRSTGFPLSTSAATSVSDAFVVMLDRESFGLKSVHVVGGLSGNDEGLAVAVDRSAAAAGLNRVYLGGRTASESDFPSVQAFDRSFGGFTEGFVARLDVDAGTPLWSSLVGGRGEDVVLALNSERPGRLFVGGTTSSDDLVPVGTPGYTKTPPGQTDLFLMEVDPDAPTPGPGPGTDAGADAGTDAGTDAGEDAGTDAGEDAGQGGAPPVPMSPLGWSCGASGGSGGTPALVLGTLAALALLAARRGRMAPRD
ncbi:DUF7948 domain-containing protein [Archangium violaceum]|uniref:DUF7948 domain-containing protein n=1 Tax=Archangium violaceum TaxID=83451 RepID=UPI0036DDA0F5